jgi:hypothetical protein
VLGGGFIKSAVAANAALRAETAKAAAAAPG